MEISNTSRSSSCSFQADDGSISTASFASSKMRELYVSSSSMEKLNISSSSIRRLSDHSVSEFDLSQSTKRFSRDSIELQELTMNRLKTDCIGLVGREAELQVVRDCVERITASPMEKSKEAVDGATNVYLGLKTDPKNGNDTDDDVDSNANDAIGRSMQKRVQHEMIFIHGYSGIGKTKLAHSIEDIVGEDDKGILVRGKYDLHCTDEPYSGLSDAFGELCHRTYAEAENHRNERRYTAISETLSSSLGLSEMKLLAKLIPELMFFFDRSANNEEEPRMTDKVYDFVVEKKRLDYAFRMLTRAFSAHFAPLVLVLDDLQWADSPSLELIQSLLTDEESSHSVMIVGCYRSNEVGDNHNLTKMLRWLQENNGSYLYQLTNIALESLSPKQTHTIVMTMLDNDDENRTRGLADTCHRRTLGNPFYVVEFITLLEWEGLIEFNIALMEWVWSQEKIEENTMSTSNVVDMLKARMTMLPDQSQLVLQYAACFGSSIHMSILEVLWTHHAVSMMGQKVDNVSDLVHSLVLARFVEYCGENVIRFVHDNVKEAVLTVGDTIKPSFQCTLGTVLLRELSDNELNGVLFDVVDLINKDDTIRNDDFARLNLRASEKAKVLSALQSANCYVEHGVRLLPNEAWSTCHDVYLRLHVIGAQVSFALGEIESFNQHADNILSRDCFSAIEKLPILATKCNKMHTHDYDLQGSIKLNLATLDSLGMPRWNRTFLPINAMAAFVSTIREAKKIPRAAYENMPVMADSSCQAIMQMLLRFNHSCYMAEKHFLMLLATTEMVRMTLKHGVNANSGSGFAMLGLLAVAVFGDFETGSYFAEIGLLLHKIFDSKFEECDTLCVAYQFILPWTQSLAECTLPMQRGYKIGMQAGNVTVAMWNLVAFCAVYPFMMGKPLICLIENCRVALPQIESAKQKDIATVARILWQVALNLTGQSHETKKLEGDVFQAGNFVGTIPIETDFVHLAQLQLLVIFGDYKAAAELALKQRSFSQAIPAAFIGMLDILTRGAAFFAMARATRKRKYIQKAKNILKTVGGWVRRGNGNAYHYYLFLCAENAALRKKKTAKVEALYQKAIVAASRSGHVHHAGLFNERYRDYLLGSSIGLSTDGVVKENTTVNVTEEEARYRHDEAIRLYGAWGATAKVQALRNTSLFLSYAVV